MHWEQPFKNLYKDKLSHLSLAPQLSSPMPKKYIDRLVCKRCLSQKCQWATHLVRVHPRLKKARSSTCQTISSFRKHSSQAWMSKLKRLSLVSIRFTGTIRTLVRLSNHSVLSRKATPSFSTIKVRKTVKSKSKIGSRSNQVKMKLKLKARINQFRLKLKARSEQGKGLKIGKNLWTRWTHKSDR